MKSILFAFLFLAVTTTSFAVTDDISSTIIKTTTDSTSRKLAVQQTRDILKEKFVPVATTSGDYNGYSVAMYGPYAITGVPRANFDGGNDRGRIETYQLNDSII